jgi:hypothetical protein
MLLATPGPGRPSSRKLTWPSGRACAFCRSRTASSSASEMRAASLLYARRTPRGDPASIVNIGADAGRPDASRYFRVPKDGTQMRIGILGSTLMGSELDAIMARAGHDVVFSYSRSRKKLDRLADDAGAHAGTPAEAVSGADAVLVAVHWSAASAESVGNTSRAVEPAGSRWSTHACMLGPRRSSHSKSGGHQDSPDLLTLRIPRVTVNTSGATSATLAIAAVPPG